MKTHETSSQTDITLAFIVFVLCVILSFYQESQQVVQAGFTALP